MKITHCFAHKNGIFEHKTASWRILKPPKVKQSKVKKTLLCQPNLKWNYHDFNPNPTCERRKLISILLWFDEEKNPASQFQQILVNILLYIFPSTINNFFLCAWSVKTLGKFSALAITKQFQANKDQWKTEIPRFHIELTLDISSRRNPIFEEKRDRIKKGGLERSLRPIDLMIKSLETEITRVR